MAIILGGAGNPDGSCNIILTISCIVVVVICGVLWRWLNPNPIHIPQEAYDDLQKDIEREANKMNINFNSFVAEAYLPDDATIYVTVEMWSNKKEYFFRDDAWGKSETFKEIDWSCDCKITKVEVLDKDGNERQSDFDENNLELKFETIQWE